MLYCAKCKIYIRGSKTRCPLCEGKLTGTPEDPAFPTLKRSGVSSFSILRVSTFVFLVLEIVMGAVWFLSSHELKVRLPWVPLVMLGGVVGWVDLVLAMYLRNNVMKIITVQAYVAMIIDFAIDRMTGFLGWSYTWMIPMTFLGLAAATFGIGMGAKLRLEDYVIYLLIDTVFCMLQLIPVIGNWSSFLWPSVICMALYLIMAAGTVVFRFRALKNASAKYFNV